MYILRLFFLYINEMVHNPLVCLIKNSVRTSGPRPAFECSSCASCLHRITHAPSHSQPSSASWTVAYAHPASAIHAHNHLPRLWMRAVKAFAGLRCRHAIHGGASAVAVSGQPPVTPDLLLKIQIKHLQDKSEIDETLKTCACSHYNMCNTKIYFWNI